LRYDFVHENTEDNAGNRHKIIVFVKNTQGHKDLIRLHNRANIEEKGVFTPRLLKEHWTENLKLAIPFYDSYLFNNTLYQKSCIPEFGEIPLTFFREDNMLPFDSLVASTLPAHAKIVDVKTVLYTRRESFETWLTYRCALNLNVKGKKRTLEAPNFDHCHSKEFSVESYLEKVNQ